MRQFVQLTGIAEQFEEIGVGIVGMTYDDAEIIQAFHAEQELSFPLLRDVDAQHVNAWGIRNLEYEEGSFAYGIPHPGVVLLSPEGRILAKWAERGYRQRADWSTVLEEVRGMVGGE